MIKISVVIPARNEAENLKNTIASLKKQTVPPQKIIVINDNSTDNTKEVALGFDCTTIDFPYNHENWVAKKELANVFNMGLSMLKGDPLDYVMILGADHILPPDYIEKITGRMNNDIVVASGVIDNEYSTVPRGSGRIVNYDYWKKLGLRYPINYGFESWLCFKALSLGHSIKSYPDIRTVTQRKTGTKYNPKLYYHYGQAMRALGYKPFYSLFRAITMVKKKKLRGAMFLIIGYMSHVTEYDAEIRKYVNSTHCYYFRNFLLLRPHHIKEMYQSLKNA